METLCCQAQPTAQLKPQLRAELALFSIYPTRRLIAAAKNRLIAAAIRPVRRKYHNSAILQPIQLKFGMMTTQVDRIKLRFQTLTLHCSIPCSAAESLNTVSLYPSNFSTDWTEILHTLDVENIQRKKPNELKFFCLTPPPQKKQEELSRLL